MVMEMIWCLARFREGAILINYYHVPRDLAFAPLIQLEVQRPAFRHALKIGLIDKETYNVESRSSLRNF